MAQFPLNLSETFGPFWMYLIFLAIGFAFGYVLELAGFGNSKKLADQFYFKDMTVLKVMFTAIIVAMVMVHGASALGLLDINLIWINPTYLWPGIVGGLIMGVGFILGGFCPGTSLVAAATAKIDGFFFVLGVFSGIFLFGETVDSFSIFWNSSYMGRYTLPQWLGIPTGTVLILVVLMALFMFAGSEVLERIFGGKDPSRAPRARYLGAGALVVAAVAVAGIGQPTTMEKWARIAPEKTPQLDGRELQISQDELLHLLHDHELNSILIDVRPEADYNLFHLADARHVPLSEVEDVIPSLHLEPPSTVFVMMSNDEAAATEAWKILVAESVPNVYILGGGINGWLEIFAQEDPRIQPIETAGQDELRFTFEAALGGAFPASDPDPHEHEFDFEPKIKLEKKRGPTGGGCG